MMPGALRKLSLRLLVRSAGWAAALTVLSQGLWGCGYQAREQELKRKVAELELQNQLLRKGELECHARAARLEAESKLCQALNAPLKYGGMADFPRDGMASPDAGTTLPKVKPTCNPNDPLCGM